MSVARVTWKKKTSESFTMRQKKVLLQIYAIAKIYLHILTNNANGV